MTAFLAAFLLAFAVLASPHGSSAGGLEIVVTTTDDDINLIGDCSLPEAIQASNTVGQTPSPTPTPTPLGQTPTPTSTPTPVGQTPSPTSSPSPTATHTSTPAQGDVDCDGDVDEEDALKLIFFFSDPIGFVEEDCATELGGGSDDFPWGDVNCDGVVNALDAI